MIFGSIALIVLTKTSNNLNLVINNNLNQDIQVHQQSMSLSVDSIDRIYTNNNQTSGVQEHGSTDLFSDITEGIETSNNISNISAHYCDMFSNQYSNVAIRFQSLNIEYIQRLNDIYSRYLNGINDQQTNTSYLSELNTVYNQYLTDSRKLFSNAYNVQEIINEIFRVENTLDNLSFELAIRQYHILLNKLFSSSVDVQHLNNIYFIYSNALDNNQRLNVVDYQSQNEYNDQTLNSLNRQFINELTNQLEYVMANRQVMDRIYIEHLRTVHEYYLRDVENYGISVSNREYINSIYANHISLVYHKIFDDLNISFLRAIEEPQSGVNNLYQSALYRRYIRIIDNLYYSPYNNLCFRWIYNHYMRCNMNTLNSNSTEN